MNSMTRLLSATLLTGAAVATYTSSASAADCKSSRWVKARVTGYSYVNTRGKHSGQYKLTINRGKNCGLKRGDGGVLKDASNRYLLDPRTKRRVWFEVTDVRDRDATVYTGNWTSGENHALIRAHTTASITKKSGPAPRATPRSHEAGSAKTIPGPSQPRSTQLGTVCHASGQWKPQPIDPDGALWLAKVVDGETWGKVTEADARAMLWTLAQRKFTGRQFRDWSWREFRNPSTRGGRVVAISAAGASVPEGAKSAVCGSASST